MPNNHPIPEEAVKNITDRDSLLNFLREHLDWQLPDDPVIEEATFRWDVEDLQVNEKTAQRLQDGTVYQLRPMVEDQPWGIFLIEFNSDRVYKTDLRNVLRGLVPKRRRDSGLPAWQHENILFICLTRNNEFTIANFRGEKPERARLIRISWTPEDPVRTLCEYNLPSLRLPDNIETWTDQWHRAFDVEKVTKTFFNEYTELFNELQEILRKQTSDKEWAHDYALHFLNRVLFLYFIQKKRWLGNDPRFMKSLWDAYRESNAPKGTFYQNWLSVLFFEAFNNKYQNRAEYVKRFPENIHKAFSDSPFLNGGLFAELEIDNKHDFKIPDSFFVQLFERYKDYHTGFLERYNFTITEETPLDQEVAVDPEMIGKVYESLVNITFEGKTEQDRRGMVGIFYTPRVEIDLMCRLSLTDWLVNNLGNDNKTVIRRAVFAYSPEEKKEADAGLTERDLWTKVNELLNSVTVLDITVGSGSFLVGMLLVIDDLKARANKVLGISETPYERRKKIIGQSLYGVDVMDWAVHVAELRLWLQLVVETELKPAELKFRPLLPNLSFKVRSGDSLVQEVGEINFGLHNEHIKVSSALRGKITALKGKKLNYYSGEMKDSERNKKLIEKEELDIFRLILREKIDLLGKEIQKKSDELLSLNVAQGELLDDNAADTTGDEKIEKRIKILNDEKASLESEIERMKNALREIKDASMVPFVWDIAFVEIFEGEKNGFDIVIGNPPYVRQEKIEDPKGLIDKKIYKAKLQRSVYEAYPDFFRYKRTQDKALRKIDGKSDLYIYFYFHGLSLLNEKGSFCFITSNSWLDVGYGKDLQEFLLKNVRIKYIIDNEAKRSFAEADINTIICLLSAPAINVERNGVSHNKSRFVMFRVSFDRALSPVIFEEIDEASDRLSREEFRVVVRKQDELLKEGIEVPKDGEPEKISIKDDKFSGDKWGGKYLRAPDIFYVLQDLSTSDKIVSIEPNIGKVVTVSWSRLGRNEEIFLKKSERIPKKNRFAAVLKSPREVNKIVFGENDTKNILLIDKGIIDKLVNAPILWVDIRGDKHLCLLNKDNVYFTHNFHGIIPNKEYEPWLITALLSSTMVWLIVEIVGRRGLGGGAVRILVKDLKGTPILLSPEYINGKSKKNIKDVFVNEISKRQIYDTFTECGLNPETPIRSQKPNPLKDRKALDDAVFDILGLTENERRDVYWSVCELAQNRLMKVRSV